MGTIASLQQTSVAPAVKRAADGLVSGFISPAAGGRGDLAERQTSVVGKVETAVAMQAKALSDAADKILQAPRVEPERFQPLSPAEAVLRYAGDFLPSWAGAISIDLMPAVLVLILCVVHAGIRREAQPETGAATMSAADIIAALSLAREVEAANGALAAPAGAGHRIRPAARGRRECHAIDRGARGQEGLSRGGRGFIAVRALGGRLFRRRSCCAGCSRRCCRRRSRSSALDYAEMLQARARAIRAQSGATENPWLSPKPSAVPLPSRARRPPRRAAAAAGCRAHGQDDV